MECCKIKLIQKPTITTIIKIDIQSFLSCDCAGDVVFLPIGDFGGSLSCGVIRYSGGYFLENNYPQVWEFQQATYHPEWRADYAAFGAVRISLLSASMGTDRSGSPIYSRGLRELSMA